MNSLQQGQQLDHFNFNDQSLFSDDFYDDELSWVEFDILETKNADLSKGNSNSNNKEVTQIHVETKAPPGSPTGIDEFNTVPLDGSFFLEDPRNPFRALQAKTMSPASTDQVVIPRRTTGFYKEEAPAMELEDSASIELDQDTGFYSASILFDQDKASIVDDSGTFCSSPFQDTAEQTAAEEVPLEVQPHMTLNVDEYSGIDFYNLMDDMEDNPHIRDAIIQLDVHRAQQVVGTKRKRNSREMFRFFQMVRSLPNLEVLHLSGFQSTDMEGMTESLYAHPTLKEFRLQLSSGVVDEISLRTLTSIPSLEEVTLEMNESSSFDVLLRSSSLKKLSIVASNGFSFENAHLVSSLQALQSNDALTELDLQAQMSFTAFKLLAYVLRVNNCLESFRVSISGGSFNEADSAMNEIAILLGRNTKLKSLWNLQYSSLKISKITKERMLKAIEQNTSLERFLMFEEDDSFSSQKEHLIKVRNKPSIFVLPGIPSCGAYTPSINLPNIDTAHYDKFAKDVMTCIEKFLVKTKTIKLFQCQGGCQSNVSKFTIWLIAWLIDSFVYFRRL